MKKTRKTKTTNGTEPHYRRITEQAHDVFYRYRFKPVRSLEYVSPSVEGVTGYTPDEHYTDPELAWKIIHPDDRPKLGDLEGMLADRMILRWITKDGRTVWMEQRQSPFTDEVGEVVGIEGIARDVTEHVLAEQALQEANEVLEAVIGSSPLAIVILDTDMKVKGWNPAAERIFGWKAEEVLEQPYPLADHSQAAEFGKLKTRVLSGESISSLETTRTTKSRAHIDVSVSVAPLRAPDGRVIGALAILADIAGRKRAEEALRESEERYRSLVEACPDPIVVHVDGKAVFVNQALLDLIGVDGPSELIGRPILDYVHPDYRHIVTERQNKMLATQDKVPVTEIKLVRPDGGVVEVEAAAAPASYHGSGAIQSVLRDISERRRVENALPQNETQLRMLIDNASDVITILAPDGKIVYNSPSIERLLGYGPAEMVGQIAFTMIHPEDLSEVGERFTRVLQNLGASESVEFRFRHKDGSWRYLEAVGRAHVDDSGAPRVIVISRDIEERKHAEETIRHMAYHDALTGLPNRALFRDRLEVAIAQARRAHHMIGVMFLDLDRFKDVNDSVGHAQGDELLRCVAEQLQLLVREGDTVARVGGDEFTVLLPEIDSPEEAVRVAERILEHFHGPQEAGGREFHVTTSIGITIFPADGDSADTLLRNADIAMYRAKEQGRDNFRLYTAAMNARIIERLTLEQDLRRALERNEFQVFYQPIANSQTLEVKAVEALVRWRHPQRGMVTPQAFIPLCEETGLILPLGEWVLWTAAQQLKSWHNSGLSGLQLSVNLSARQFQRPNLVEQVEAVLSETGIPAESLHLEITEGIAMTEREATVGQMERLRALGARIWIDDFGVGQSSLTYLKRFPINALKIDRSFIGDLENDPSDAALTTAIIAMAHSLGLTAIAEGVETWEQLAFLREQGCEYFQGYLLTQPVPADEIAPLIPRLARLAVDPAPSGGG